MSHAATAEVGVAAWRSLRTPSPWQRAHVFHKLPRTAIQVLQCAAAPQGRAHLVGHRAREAGLCQGGEEAAVVDEALVHRHRPHHVRRGDIVHQRRELAEAPPASDGLTGADLKRVVEDGKKTPAFDRAHAGPEWPLLDYLAEVRRRRPNRPVYYDVTDDFGRGQGY
jgi:hypothetical protein